MIITSISPFWASPMPEMCIRDSTCPLKPLGLAGRTGRGDTTFSAYITERERADIPQALAYASQLVSLKMQTPGPFKGDRADVASFADKYYH